MAEPQQDSKICILQVAAKLFAKLGLDKCSTREIAKEAKANISLISYYSGGKEGLYREVMRPEINATLYFTLLCEGVWGFFELQKCPTPLVQDPNLLKNQISKIFIEGALL